MSNGYVNSFDGTKLFYSVEGSGRPILFLYGLVCSSAHWKYQLEHFKKTNTVIWFDYRGHHNSEIPKETSSMSIENMAWDGECVLNNLGIDKIDVVGHSIGVSVALELYHRLPDRVTSLILSNGTARSPLESLLKTNVPQYIHPLLFEAYKYTPKLMNFFWSNQGSSQLVYWLISRFGFNHNLAKREDIETYIQNFSKLDMIVFLEIMKNYEKYDATPWLDQIDIPTLIVSGEKDWVTPREAQEMMNQLIPGSKLESIRNGSHCPQLDIPDLMNIIFDRFYNEIYKSKK